MDADKGECTCPEHGNWIAAGDVNRLVRELDVLLNGEDGAAKQASLCDIVSQVASQHFVLVRRADVPSADEVEAIRARDKAYDDDRAWEDRRTLLLLLDAARAELAGVREAAEPFVEVANNFQDSLPDARINTQEWAIPKVGDFRRLAAALAKDAT
jgi:hypothetical protein